MFTLAPACKVHRWVRPTSAATHTPLALKLSITHTLHHHRYYSTTPIRQAPSSSKPYTFNLPQLSPSFQGGTLTKWYVQPEQSLNINDLICDITTNTLTEDNTVKQVVQLESQEEGKVVKHLVDVGGDIKLGVPLLEIECEDDMQDRSYAWQAYVKKDKK